MRRARDARRDGPCQCACSLLPRVAFGRSSDQDVHLVIVGDDPIPAPRSSGCRGFAVARLRRYLPAPAESAVCRVSARDSETTKGSKRSQAVRAAYNVIIAYHLGERGAHADARGRGVSLVPMRQSSRARIAAHRRTERRSRRGGCGGGRRPRAVCAASRPPGLMAPASRRHMAHFDRALY